jgi:hypothetical protein
MEWNRLTAKYRTSFEIQTARSSSDCLEKLAKSIERRDGKIDVCVDSNLAGTIGSRSELRLYGLFMKAGRESLPIKVVATTSGTAGEILVNVELESNEGWYLFRLPALAKAYRKAFASLESELEDLLSP